MKRREVVRFVLMLSAGGAVSFAVGALLISVF